MTILVVARGCTWSLHRRHTRARLGIGTHRLDMTGSTANANLAITESLLAGLLLCQLLSHVLMLDTFGRLSMATLPFDRLELVALPIVAGSTGSARPRRQRGTAPRSARSIRAVSRTSSATRWAIFSIRPNHQAAERKTDNENDGHVGTRERHGLPWLCKLSIDPICPRPGYLLSRRSANGRCRTDRRTETGPSRRRRGRCHTHGGILAGLNRW